MNRLALLLVSCAVSAGCATNQAAPQAAAYLPTECGQLEREIASTGQAKREALEKQKTAWKAVIPFAVAARHASAKSEAAEADKRLDELRTESSRRGCSSGQRT